MSKSSRRDDIQIEQAAIELAKIAELNVDSLIDYPGEAIGKEWISDEGAKQATEEMRSIFGTVHKYLKSIDLKEAAPKKGIEALMNLASEAAEKIDQINSFFHTEVTQSIRDSREYQNLEEYYQKKVQKKLKQTVEAEDTWALEWNVDTENVFDVHRIGLKDLETVKKDWDYELLYLKREDGRAFFNRNLLRHIKLVTDFDQLLLKPEIEDPFVSIHVYFDRMISLMALDIKNRCQILITEFLKEYKKYGSGEVPGLLRNCILALSMSANVQNRLESKGSKASMKYFNDCLLFLYQILKHPDYFDFVHTPVKKEKDFSAFIVRLVEQLCYHYYHCEISIQSLPASVLQLMNMEKKSKASIWSYLLDQYDLLKQHLRHLPNGPLFKAIDYFKEAQDPIHYNPSMLDNHPYVVFDIYTPKNKISCIKLPAPVEQSFIHKAVISPAFLAALDCMSKERKKKHFLIFNLQDRTSWKEFARCEALEQLQNDARYKDLVTVITMPKYTDFYKQAGDYLKYKSARKFLKSVIEHVESYESCGFYFPKGMDMPKLMRFTKKIVPWMHKKLFSAKTDLSRQERLNFIEIFYQLFIAQIIEMLQPSEFSFTCKDWIDVGPSQTASFYSFMHLMMEKPSEDLEMTIQRISLMPALLIRERLIDETRYHRMISFLSLMDEKMQKNKELRKEMQGFFKGISPEKAELKFL